MISLGNCTDPEYYPAVAKGVPGLPEVGLIILCLRAREKHRGLRCFSGYHSLGEGSCAFARYFHRRPHGNGLPGAVKRQNRGQPHGFRPIGAVKEKICPRYWAHQRFFVNFEKKVFGIKQV